MDNPSLVTPWDMAAPSAPRREPYFPELHSTTAENENAPLDRSRGRLQRIQDR
ncbi:uncharacterized protein LACBIDRAFT_305587 [Laccaria bicolor S238N-H82]|uniref:Predicted protein n=1 Tax=Laccaria bicolor (strain S238N-H82 / ATCC MYA-4686) TaxID=486041 RepID=B0CUL9_LACBS|nr:uncharacterized protein LACBIDRAFT_305587 [Laccaria bicolor S238N-H82]EDR14694.1 predicted protein [Laccaria bicolor S238N-H82]|eukprot:XP_001875253.1 predicted protein [Laccaria bicolor S238N-H82]